MSETKQEQVSDRKKKLLEAIEKGITELLIEGRDSAKASEIAERATEHYEFRINSYQAGKNLAHWQEYTTFTVEKRNNTVPAVWEFSYKHETEIAGENTTGRCPRCSHDTLDLQGWNSKTVAYCSNCDFWTPITTDQEIGEKRGDR